MKTRLAILAVAAATLAFPTGALGSHHEPPAMLCASDNASVPSDLPETEAIPHNAAWSHCANRP